MITKSLRQCHACRLTWFPQAGTASCPACGGTKLGGTLELFHVGLALIAFGLIGWLFRHGPLSESGAAPEAAAAAVHGAQLTATPERHNDVYVASKKIKTDKVKVKRRQKKAKTRSKHVQR